MTDKRSVTLKIRVTPEENEQLLAYVKSEHINLSTWARQVLMKAAAPLLKAKNSKPQT